MEVRTQAIHFQADSKLLTFIDKKAAKLERFASGIRSVDVSLRLENAGQIRDKVVELQVNLSGTTLFAKQSSRKFETAVESCISKVRSRLARDKGRTALRAGR